MDDMLKELFAEASENIVADEAAKSMMKILEVTYTNGEKNKNLGIDGPRLVKKSLRIFDAYRAELEKELNLND